MVVRRLAVQVAQKLPWLSGQSPRRIAPALTRFVACSPVWEAQDVLCALTDAATRHGKTPPAMDRVVARPWALLAAMLRELDEVNDYPGDPFPAPIAEPAALQPSCDRFECDGWINTLDCERVTSTRACADPEHRRAHHDDDSSTDDADVNPF